ncbi:iron-containing alcohol dehydrogenase, partial [Psychrobacter aquimaris]|uniref:iron-containing alcohol dehydrogenase n=1 Tax=Psychrobacter aquimaris TaxID=292733 RepID=UPI003FD4E93C
VPNVNFFGPGCLEVVGQRCQILGGKHALIVTDPFLATLKDGAVEKTIAYLDAVGISSSVFSGVQANPKDSDVTAGLACYQDNQCDMIVTVGGGSPHDCGKAIGIMATHSGKIGDYAGIDTLSHPLPPIVSVNTTAGTASEVTRHCVITDTKTHLKYVIVSWRNLPMVSINDPLLMIGKPRALTAATGMDALTHAVEAYVSVDANPVTDAAAIQAIKLIANNLRTAVANGSDLKARENMAYASLLAGMAFNNGNLGYVHAMAHQLGGLYDMPHGVANAILLPHVCRYNLIANVQKFADIAGFLGENTVGCSAIEAAEKAINALFRLSADVAIPAHLSELGVKEQDFELMADNALKDGNAFSNPRKGTKEDIVLIFKAAY